MMKKSTTRETYRKRIRKSYALLARSLDAPVDIDALASESAFSRYHFHRIYTALVGETVADTHRRLRLDRAASHIVENVRSITDIAMASGYETPQSFSRAFKAQFGLSPAQYKKAGKSPNDGAQAPLYPPINKETISVNVTIENRQEEIVYGVHHVGPYNGIAGAFNTLWQWVLENNLQERARAGIGIYYDDPTVTLPSRCHSDACVAFDAPLAEPPKDENIQTIRLAAGRYARYRHVGPYSTLEQAYGTFCGQWLPNSGYECADLPAFEIYLNNPCDTPESELITDIYMALKG